MGSVRQGGGGYVIVSPEARAWINALSTKPPVSMWPSIDTFFLTVVADTTLWAALIGLYLSVYEYNAAATIDVNAKTPGTFNAITDFTRTPGSYVQGNGTSQKGRTGINPSLLASAQNNFGYSVWSVTPDQINTDVVFGNNTCSMGLRSTANGFTGRVNSATSRTATVTDASGLFTQTRSGALSTNDIGYRNAVAMTEAAGGVSSTPDNAELWIYARNSTVPLYSSRKFLCAAVHNNLASAKVTVLYNALYTLFLNTGVILETTISTFGNDKFFAEGSSIAISGSYYGDSADIDIRVLNALTGTVAVDWATIAVAPSGGTWSGNLTAPSAGGPYSVQTRKHGSTAPFGTAGNFFIGDIPLMIGQSNMQKMGEERTPLVSNANTRRYQKGDAWNLPSLVLQSGETGVAGGDGQVAFENLLFAGIGKPIGAINAAQGSTTMEDWTPPSGTAWVFAQSFITGSLQDPGYPALTSVFWLQGEGNASTADGAAYKAAFLSMVAQIRTNASNANLPVFIALIGPHRADAFEAGRDIIRQALIQLIDENTPGNLYWAGTATDCILLVGDDVHFTKDSYSQRLAPRYAQARLKQLGLSTYGSDGPKVAAAASSIGSNLLTVTVTQDHGTTLWDASNNPAGTALTNFDVEVDSVTRTVTAAVLSSGTIRLTFDGAPALLAARVRYCYGNCFPNTNPVYDNVQVPGSTLGLPLQPTRGWVNAVVA